MVTKAAQYGIKIYVITDAATAFIFLVVIYTGKTTYYSDPDSLQDRLKMVQVVNCLVKPFVGAHRTIYINRFYTSLDLLKSLAEKQLYVTGTMLANPIPQGVRVAKTSQTSKQMKRGDALQGSV
jgi:hypothetical protein